MLFSAVSIVAVLTAAVAAQGTGDLPKCAQDCVGNSLSSTGCNGLDVKCICSKADYISKLSCCVSGACSADDIKKTIAYASNICLAVAVTVPTAASCASTSAPTGTASVSNATASSTSLLLSLTSTSTSLTSTATSTGTAGSAKTTAASGAGNKEYVGAGLGMAAACLLAGVL